MRFSRETLEYSNKIVEANDFTWKRGLEAYFQALAGFRTLFEDLPKGAVWLDLGAGGAFAMENAMALKPSQHLEMHAFGVKIPDGQQTRIRALRESENFDYHEGKLEDFDLDSIPKADVITDLFGVLTYSPNLELVLKNCSDS